MILVDPAAPKRIGQFPFYSSSFRSSFIIHRLDFIPPVPAHLSTLFICRTFHPYQPLAHALRRDRRHTSRVLVDIAIGGFSARLPCAQP
jgi:hypothetical protein